MGKKKKLKKAIGMGAALLASNYVGKRAGEADAALNAAKQVSGLGKVEKPSAFGFSINPENRIKSKLSLDTGGITKAESGVFAENVERPKKRKKFPSGGEKVPGKPLLRYPIDLDLPKKPLFKS